MVAPSLLSANFCNLQKDIEMINDSQADWLHLDVMDGVSCPISLLAFPFRAGGCHLQEALDVHLMIVEPKNSSKR